MCQDFNSATVASVWEGCLQALLAFWTNVLFTWQARWAKAREAAVSAVQPIMGQDVYGAPAWTLGTLCRCSAITLVGGSIAGAFHC